MSQGSRERKRRWLWLWIAAILTVNLVPYAGVAAMAPPGKVFLGSLLNTDDTAQFLAAMRQGSQGRWLYRNPFTPEDTSPVLMYPLYIAWGRMTGWTGLDRVVALHLLRLIGVTLLSVVIAHLAQALLGHGLRADLWRTAFLVVVFSSGLGWLAAFLPQEIGTRLMADLSLIEMSTFQSMYVVPHFAWGLMLQLLTVFCLLRAVECSKEPRVSWRWALGGGLACIGMGMVYPFALVVVCAVVGGAALLALVTRREGARAALWTALTILAFAAPLVAYYAFVFGADPLWHATHVAGNTTGSPSLLSTILGYGLVLVMAVFGAVWLVRRRLWREHGAGLLLVWVVIQGLLPYAPVPFQGRFAAGWHAALSLLAAVGIEWLSSRFRPSTAQRSRNIATILTIPSTLLILLAGPYMAITQGTYPFFLPREELRAVDWVAEHAVERDVAMASYAIGNTIPTRAPGRVVAGHQFGTYQLDEKLASIERFYGAEASDAERLGILRRYGVTLVYHGRIERRIGAFDPTQADYLEAVYDEAGIVVYAVDLDRAEAGAVQGGDDRS